MAGEFSWERLNSGFPFYRYRNRYVRAACCTASTVTHALCYHPHPVRPSRQQERVAKAEEGGGQ